MYTIPTLTALRQHLGLAASDTADDTRLLGALQAASAQIERVSGRHFCPRIAALKHVVERYDTRCLTLRDDLLALTSITDGDGTSISLNEVLLKPDTGGPYSLMHLANGRAFIRSTLLPVTVTGVWGWHDRWNEAWRGSSDTVQNNPLSSSSTTLTVSSASGADSAGQSPRFQVGHLLKIEEEYLRVLAISGNTLTVLRGINGSTAAQHAQNTAISTLQPAPDALLLALRWATWLYREGDNDTPPDDLRAALAELRRDVLRL
ncbi:MAG: hypothetical protein HXY40_08125 [Chloroflexi bacterium]|nr:hypothetical protein [Chloroflexota bacterium]